MQQKLILAGAIIFAILAFVLSGRYMVNQKNKLFAGNKRITVLVAANALNSGTAIEPESDLGVLKVFENSIGKDVFTYSEDNVNLLRGKRITRRLEPREVIRWSDVDIPQFNRGGFAEAIGTGMGMADKDLYRAISVPVSTETSVAGLVRPNDQVDMIGTYIKPLPNAKDSGDVEVVTRTILQNVTVLAVGQEYAGATSQERSRFRRGGSYSTITVQVTPREAELLVFIQQAKGKLTFALRRPGNLEFEDELPRVDFEHIDAELEKLDDDRQKLIQKAARGGR